jgi:hypothetical protein
MMETDKWQPMIPADEWNAKHPPGTPVRYYPVRGRLESIVTVTRSAAWTLPNGIVVVQLQGRAGSFTVEAVIPL